MISVEEALRSVLENARPLPGARVALAASLGLTLGEDVASDIDSPPYDKSMVDGFALRAADLGDGQVELELIEEIMAGGMPTLAIGVGNCARIMTGAPLPDGADAVVMQEYTELLARDAREMTAPPRVRFHDDPIRAGQNILRRGAALEAGDAVLRAGRRIRPIEIGLLAEVGRATVLAVPRPTVAVLATGNELVPVGKRPTGAEIRNSNGPLLFAAASRCGAMPIDLGIARDEPGGAGARLREGLRSDVLVVSGGVSTGMLDLVPGALGDSGVAEVFHKIRMKPGKPLWFGVRREGPGLNRTLVFGLPGNPVSSFVGFELFVKPAIARLAGRDVGGSPKAISARLGMEFAHRGDRPTYHPAILNVAEGTAVPLRWAGSADLRALADANGLIAFPAGDRIYGAGEAIEAIWLDD